MGLGKSKESYGAGGEQASGEEQRSDQRSWGQGIDSVGHDIDFIFTVRWEPSKDAEQRDDLTYVNALSDTWVDNRLQEGEEGSREASQERNVGSTRGVKNVSFWVDCEGRANGDSNGLHVKCERRKNQG